MKKAFKITGFIALIIFFLAALYIGFIYWCITGGLLKLEKFDRDKWLSSPSDYAGNHEASTCLDRAYMAYDIKSRIIHTGVSRDDVIKLLGLPSDKEEPVYGAAYGRAKYRIRYFLGMCRCGADYDSLVIYLDENHLVTQVVIHE